jgi:hypothetical protein
MSIITRILGAGAFPQFREEKVRRPENRTRDPIKLRPTKTEKRAQELLDKAERQRLRDEERERLRNPPPPVPD